MARHLHGACTQLEQANQDLENKVRARTAELEGLNHRLQLETRSRDEFFRAVSHDLSAPLRNIGGLASLLLARHQDLLAQDARAKLERIHANVQVQAAMIHDLLELSRIRTPGGPRRALGLTPLLAELRDSLSYDLERARVSLEVAGPLPTIVAEPNRIRQVFQNLLDNAAKYMLDAPVRRIRVSCETTERYYRFTVADTGPGIAPADLPRLFQVFQRGRGPAALRVPGRGVGLAGVKAIVESYGGTVGVDSTPGRGAAFHFTLDRRVVDRDAQAPAQISYSLNGHQP
jgi:signal transduction histidine kinase